MIKTSIISIFFTILLTANSFSAGSGDGETTKKRTQYDMAVSLVKAAKKFEKKDKLEKAKKISKSTKIIN